MHANSECHEELGLDTVVSLRLRLGSEDSIPSAGRAIHADDEIGLLRGEYIKLSMIVTYRHSMAPGYKLEA
jgi:hypothetical protein